MSELAVAAAQIECRPGDIDSNLALHLTAVAEARAQGINLLVFPELSLTDYMSEPDVDALARTADAPELCRVAEAAGRTAVSMGFLERGEMVASITLRHYWQTGAACPFIASSTYRATAGFRRRGTTVAATR